MIKWKSLEEAPTEPWSGNENISKHYLVLCEGNTTNFIDDNPTPVIGYAAYGFITKSWEPCFHNTAGDCRKVIAWSEDLVI